MCGLTLCYVRWLGINLMLTRQYLYNPLKTSQSIGQLVCSVTDLSLALPKETLSTFVGRLDWGAATSCLTDSLFFNPNFGSILITDLIHGYQAGIHARS